MRQICINLEPLGFAVEKGKLRYYYSTDQLKHTTACIETNPPKGSGRPKGSTRKGGRK